MMIFIKRHKPVLFAFLTAISILNPLYVISQNGKAANGSNGIFSEPAEYEKYDLELLPSAFTKMNNERSPYIIMVDKSKQKLLLFNYDSDYHLVKSFKCVTGENDGTKLVQGDKKTPEGIYFFDETIDLDNLRKEQGRFITIQYGIMAYDTDYPNPVDLIYKRTGYGIWMHGTNDPERAMEEFSTRGCIVLNNSDIKTISQFIDMFETPIIIENNIEYVSRETCENDYLRVKEFLDQWIINWGSRDYKQYLSGYNHNFRSGMMNYYDWASYKRRVLKDYKWIEIEISNIRIFSSDKYIFAEFDQKFKSDLYSDYGRKKLYLVEEGNRLKILSEDWTAFSDEKPGKIEP